MKNNAGHKTEGRTIAARILAALCAVLIVASVVLFSFM